MILGGGLPGKVSGGWRIILDSSAVEHPAVNRRVVGSNPTRGVIRPDGQAVKTRPFHGCNPGSIPGRVILKFYMAL